MQQRIAAALAALIVSCLFTSVASAQASRNPFTGWDMPEDGSYVGKFGRYGIQRLGLTPGGPPAAAAVKLLDRMTREVHHSPNQCLRFRAQGFTDSIGEHRGNLDRQRDLANGRCAKIRDTLPVYAQRKSLSWPAQAMTCIQGRTNAPRGQRYVVVSYDTSVCVQHKRDWEQAQLDRHQNDRLHALDHQRTGRVSVLERRLDGVDLDGDGVIDPADGDTDGVVPRLDRIEGRLDDHDMRLDEFSKRFALRFVLRLSADLRGFAGDDVMGEEDLLGAGTLDFELRFANLFNGVFDAFVLTRFGVGGEPDLENTPSIDRDSNVASRFALGFGIDFKLWLEQLRFRGMFEWMSLNSRVSSFDAYDRHDLDLLFGLTYDLGEVTDAVRPHFALVCGPSWRANVQGDESRGWACALGGGAAF